MKITTQELLDMGACNGGLNRFIEQTGGTEDAVNVTDLIGGKITYSDLLWLAGKKFTSARLVRFACDCALLNIEKVKPYTDKYDAILTFLRNPSEAEADDAEAIYWAYDAVTRSAIAARSAAAAGTAARSAAAASHAARSAAAASHAALSTFWAAKVSEESKQKVDDLLIEMFSELE